MYLLNLGVTGLMVLCILFLQVKYSLSFRSSNESVMEHPRANIPLQGFVPKRTKGNQP